MAYADFTYYSETFQGEMTETEFSKWSVRASNHIDSITFGESATAPASMADNLKIACCEYSDLLKAKDDVMKSTNYGSIVSENNDGISQSFQNHSDFLTTYKQKDRYIALEWLVSPYNLMSGGVIC